MTYITEAKHLGAIALPYFDKSRFDAGTRNSRSLLAAYRELDKANLILLCLPPIIFPNHTSYWRSRRDSAEARILTLQAWG